MLYKFNENNLKFENIAYQVYAFILVFSLSLILIAFGVGYAKGNNKVVENITLEEKLIIINQQDQFTPEKLKEYLLELNIKFPHIVYAQSLLETNHFKSQIFKVNNNLFGMKQARVRATTNQGTELGHAIYKHWRESVVDYALFQNAYLNKIGNEDAYFDYLSQNYAEDKEYVNKLKKLIEQYKSNI
jgi:uncharacterized FlgJ-related protein